MPDATQSPAVPEASMLGQPREAARSFVSTANPYPPSSALRIDVIEPSGRLYGSELALLDILERLPAESFQCDVLLPVGSPFRGHLCEQGISYTEVLPPSSSSISRVRKMAAYLKVAWRWRARRPDLIYVNQGGILRPIALIARRLGIPILCQIQTVEDAQWVSSLTACHAQVSAFVCNSDFTAHHARVPAERRSTVYYGYRPKGLRRSQPLDTRHGDRFTVGLLARIGGTKGHDLVIEAAGRLRRSGDARFHFRFIGDAPDPCERQRVATLIDRHGCADRIEFRGYRENIGAELAALNLLIIPSVAEPFGRILCEAAEAQVPVLLADSGGLGELSHRFRIGLRFTAGNVDHFIEQLQTAERGYAGLRRDFQAGAERLLTALDFSEYIHVMAALIRRAAAGGPVSVTWHGLSAPEGRPS
jgi:glycosyltransferase involved in cell wall biosynthesis